MELRAGVLACLGLVLVSKSVPAQTLPDGPGKDVFEVACNACHTANVVVGMQKTKQEWRSKVTEMLQEEIDVSSADADAIVEYLAKNFPKTVAKLNVNKATAKELQSVFSPGDSEAIVRYRDQKGNLKTIDELKKVPGLDHAKIEANKDRLEF